MGRLREVLSGGSTGAHDRSLLKFGIHIFEHECSKDDVFCGHSKHPIHMFHSESLQSLLIKGVPELHTFNNMTMEQVITVPALFSVLEHSA